MIKQWGYKASLLIRFLFVLMLFLQVFCGGIGFLLHEPGIIIMNEEHNEFILSDQQVKEWVYEYRKQDTLSNKEIWKVSRF